LVNASQVVRLAAYKGAEIKTSLTLGFAGSASQALNFEIKVTDQDASLVENVKHDSVLAESVCGKSTMITGNLNLLVSGSSAQAFVSTGTAIVTLKIVP